MNLDEIMRAMGERGEYKGNMSFETLALASSVIEKRRLVFIDDMKYISDTIEDNCVVLTTQDIALAANFDSFCICHNPRILFFRIHNFLSHDLEYIRKEFDTQIGENCTISPLSSIARKNVIIGNNVQIEEFVAVRENTVIGDNSIIRAGVIIGGQGFEFKRSNDVIGPVSHLGGVIISKNVEIQYNTCIDRAIYPWDNTEIGDFSKIDNLVHIAHGVKIKKNVMVVANVLIGGRTIIGNDSWLGASATIMNGISMGQKTRANIGSVVTKPIPDNGSVTGNFAIEHERFIKNLKNILNSTDEL